MTRLLVIAAHPDAETAGAASLLTTLPDEAGCAGMAVSPWDGGAAGADAVARSGAVCGARAGSAQPANRAAASARSGARRLRMVTRLSTRDGAAMFP